MIQSMNDLTATYGEIGDVSTSDPYKLLRVERRRIALDILCERTPPIELADLAAAIAVREAIGDVTEEEILEEVQKEIAISLHHAHLPVIEEFGIIDYDASATRIESVTRCPESLSSP